MATRPVFDVRTALCFVAVAEEASFTKAAERLGMTQPSVSEMIQRLESRLGFPLFVRTSRRAQLTAKGRVFLIPAQKLARANAEAQAFALALKRGMNDRLRIGAPFVSASIPERATLMETYMRKHPRVDLEVVHGNKSELLNMVHTGETHLGILIRPFDELGLQCLTIHHGVGHFLVPIEDPLARRQGVRLSDLAGYSVVTPPRDRDPEYVASHFDALAACGATLVPAPEGIDSAMETFARLRRMVHLRFGLGQGVRKVIGDMVRLPIIDRPIDLEYALIRRTNTLPAVAQAFWTLAHDLFSPGKQAP